MKALLKITLNGKITSQINAAAVSYVVHHSRLMYDEKQYAHLALIFY